MVRMIHKMFLQNKILKVFLLFIESHKHFSPHGISSFTQRIDISTSVQGRTFGVLFFITQDVPPGKLCLDLLCIQTFAVFVGI